MDSANRNKKDDPLKGCILTFPGLEDEERNDGLEWKQGNVTLERIDRHRQAVPLHPDTEGEQALINKKGEKSEKSFGFFLLLAILFIMLGFVGIAVLF